MRGIFIIVLMYIALLSGCSTAKTDKTDEMLSEIDAIRVATDYMVTNYAIDVDDVNRWCEAVTVDNVKQYRVGFQDSGYEDDCDPSYFVFVDANTGKVLDCKAYDELEDM